ncbi:MAG: hypothetical protein RSD54_08090, partial [Ruthenibacterium sp.]
LQTVWNLQTSPKVSVCKFIIVKSALETLLPTGLVGNDAVVKEVTNNRQIEEAVLYDETPPLGVIRTNFARNICLLHIFHSKFLSSRSSQTASFNACG